MNWQDLYTTNDDYALDELIFFMTVNERANYKKLRNDARKWRNFVQVTRTLNKALR